MIGADLFLTAVYIAVGIFVRKFLFGGDFPDSFSWEALSVLVLLWAPATLATMGVAAALPYHWSITFWLRTPWTWATVTLPLILAYLAWQWHCLGLAAGGLALIALKFYGEVWEWTNLHVQKGKIKAGRIRQNIRLVHLSDIQTDGITRHFIEAREAANAFDPDLVIFTGDLVNHPKIEPEAADYLRGFKSKKGAFLVSGNWDDDIDFNEFSKAAGFTFLDNKSLVLDFEGQTLGMMGLSAWNHQNSALLNSLSKTISHADLRILLSHYPDALAITDGQADLLLSGHTHGGQICLPWAGPILTYTRAPRRIAAGGLHQRNKLWISVSRGLGGEGALAPRVRTFCRPHLILMEISPD